MEDLFDPVTHAKMRNRIRAITPDSPRQWGKMSPAQMLEHCTLGMQKAIGELNLPASGSAASSVPSLSPWR